MFTDLVKLSFPYGMRGIIVHAVRGLPLQRLCIPKSNPVFKKPCQIARQSPLKAAINHLLHSFFLSLDTSVRNLSWKVAIWPVSTIGNKTKQAGIQMEQKVNVPLRWRDKWENSLGRKNISINELHKCF